MEEVRLDKLDAQGVMLGKLAVSAAVDYNVNSLVKQIARRQAHIPPGMKIGDMLGHDECVAIVREAVMTSSSQLVMIPQQLVLASQS
jgi:hypothetical protein